MILTATFSKPVSNCEEILGRPYIRIKIRKSIALDKAQGEYECEMFTEKQSFHKKMTASQTEEFIKSHAGTTFKSAVIRTETEEKSILSNRHGKIRTITKKTDGKQIGNAGKNFNREKNYIIRENTDVPFMKELGIMTKEGKIASKKYDKFRQINRFLEFVDDILDTLKKMHDGEITSENPLRIVDFGSGKSYLTFAVYHYLHEIKKIPCDIEGIDLKTDVIEECAALAKKIGYTGLHFMNGNIADYSNPTSPDLVMTLHACDTATDYALEYAARKNASAILSVPCCHKEINLQLEKMKLDDDNPFGIFMKYGIVRERFASLFTDLVRCEILEKCGYSVQLLEFIDMEGTPKNLLVRAVKSNGEKKTLGQAEKILLNLKLDQTLKNLLKKE